LWHKNIAGRFFGLVTKHACDRQTDGQTDGQNYDSQDRASIAASRGNKCVSSRLPNCAGGKLFKSLGAVAAKLHGPNVTVLSPALVAFTIVF